MERRAQALCELSAERGSSSSSGGIGIGIGGTESKQRPRRGHLRDERRHGVWPQVEPLDDACSDGQHVFEAAADLDADDVYEGRRRWLQGACVGGLGAAASGGRGGTQRRPRRQRSSNRARRGSGGRAGGAHPWSC